MFDTMISDRLDKPRRLLMQLVSDAPSDVTLASLSEGLGRNRAYLQQYVHRGSPRELKEGDRIALGKALGVTPRALKTGELDRDIEEHDDTPDRYGVVTIPMFEFRAGMGGGGVILDEDPAGIFPIPRPYLRKVRLGGANLVSITCEGDSMTPTLMSGDQVMIDVDDRNPARGGIFALHDGDTLVVKRVETIPMSDPPMVRLISDNTFHNSYDVLAEQAKIVGRVVWYARRI